MTLNIETQGFDPSKFTIFFHIPKTGGSSISDIFYQVYSSDYKRMGSKVLSTKFQQDHIITDTKATLGHYTFLDPLYKHINQPINHLTIVREPVDRVVSQYYFLRGDEQHPLHKLALRYTLFELFHTQIDAAYELGMINRQTNLLSSYTGSTRANLRISSAKNNLRDNFTFFGIHDAIDEFVEICSFYLNWPAVEVPKANSSGRPPLEEIPSNICKAISDNNLLDRELYGYAQMLYEARVAELRDGMEAQIPEAIEVIAITATGWQRFKSWFARKILRRKNV